VRALIAASIVCLLAVPVRAKYGGGTGTAYDPYQIRTPQQMNEIGLYREDWDKYFRLMADIDLRGCQGASFNIIASRDGRAGFTGVFDGNGHTISNLSYICHDNAWLGPVTVDCASGEIRFYVKVSTEWMCDIVRFKIDGWQMEYWSGEVDWTEVSFPVEAGRHTFEWRYHKDESHAPGDDTAWIDDIVFPIE
jgi:hypothetical protein